MHRTYTPPSTIPGISRLAKSLRQQNGIKHTQALEEAAKVAGFQSFKHAKRALAASVDTDTFASLYLTVFWHDRDAMPFSGRCTACVLLPQRTVELLPTLKVRGLLMFGSFQLESPDHLRATLDASSQYDAKRRIDRALRELLFSEATGLMPMTKQADIQRFDVLRTLPGMDHLSMWICPTTGQALALDEPYGPRLELNQSRRTEWLGTNKLSGTAPNWEGLYAPGSTVPYLVSPSADLLQQTKSAVETLVELPSVDWISHSGPYHTNFLSPRRLASGKRYRPRPQRSFAKRAGAVPYGGGPGWASQWRPAEAMCVEDHLALGALLRGLAWSRISGRIHAALMATVSRLDDWSMCEHPDESSQTLSALYYGSERTDCSSVEKQIAVLRQARQLVVEGYNDCRPRTDLLTVFDKVESAVRAAAERGKADLITG